MNLLDADVCIDILRLRPEALEWLDNTNDVLCIAGFAAVELAVGCHDTQELNKLRRFLKRFPIVWASEDEMNHALTEYAPFFLSHGLGGFDALIAATVTGQGATLYTFNDKHFRAIPNLSFAAPYTRI